MLDVVPYHLIGKSLHVASTCDRPRVAPEQDLSLEIVWNIVEPSCTLYIMLMIAEFAKYLSTTWTAVQNVAVVVVSTVGIDLPPLPSFASFEVAAVYPCKSTITGQGSTSLQRFLACNESDLTVM